MTLKTAPPWCTTEAHRAAGEKLDAIPQTRKGSPIQGRFEYSADPGCTGEVVFPDVTGGSIFSIHSVVRNNDTLDVETS